MSDVLGIALFTVKMGLGLALGIFTLFAVLGFTRLMAEGLADMVRNTADLCGDARKWLRGKLA